MAQRLVFLLTVAACAPSQAPRPAAAPPAAPGLRIDTLAIRGHTRFLADDRLAGRATGSPGAELAALYIESTCMSLGLSPVGSAYRQAVELEEATISGRETELIVTDATGSRAFEYPWGFLPNVGLAPPAGFAGPAVYAETGNDLLGAGAPPLSGAVAVIGGAVGRDTDDSLKARGAVGLVQLASDQNQYLLFVRSRGESRLTLADSAIARSFSTVLPSIVAGPDLSRRLLAGHSGAKAARLRDSITVRVSFERRPVTSSNVLCLLPGTDPRAKDTAVAYSAHYDHLGVGMPDARGDSIYNGFSDNAAGVGMLVAIAQAFGSRSGPRPPYSVLFFFFTGEEQGLLGSDYYVARPTWPLTRIRGVINLDAGAPPARPWSWRIAGGDRQPLGRLAQDVAAEHGWSATTSPATPNSDYYPFAQAGVPAVFIVPGPGPYQGLSVDSSQALRRRWDRYHDPADEWAPDFPFAGLGRYAEYAYYIGRALGDGGVARAKEP